MQHGLEQVDVDHLPDAAMHRDHCGERSHQCRDLVGEGDGWKHRTTIGFAVHIGESRHGLGQRGETGPMRVGAGLTESAHPGDDQLRIGRNEFLGA